MNCQMCNRPSSTRVTIIQKKRPGSQLAIGYCLQCQEWILMFDLISLVGIAIFLVGLFSLNINNIGMGFILFVIAFLLPGIIKSLLKKR